MITERTADAFGIAAIVAMLALLLLVAFRVVPASWDLPFFLSALALFAVRLILRAVLARRRRDESPRTDPPASS